MPLAIPWRGFIDGQIAVKIETKATLALRDTDRMEGINSDTSWGAKSEARWGRFQTGWFWRAVMG